MELLPEPANLYSRIEELSRTNNAATDLELTQIKALTRKDEYSLALLDLEIEEAEAHLDEFKARRLVLHERIHTCHIVLSPIRRLPPEILREIMLCFCAPILSFNGKLPALPLSQVCFRWRELALTTSRLWSTFTIHQKNGSYARWNFLDMCVRRAEATPLAIKIIDLDLIFRPEALSRILHPRSATVRELSLSVHGAAVRKSTDHHEVPCSMPLLESLSLFLGGGVSPASVLGAWVLNAPRLRTVALRTRIAHIGNDLVTVPWRQLTSLSLHGFSLSSDFTHVLEQLEDLEECSLFFRDPDPLDEEDFPSLSNHIVLPQVRRLLVRSLYDSSGPQLFSMITVPALTNLSISTSCWGPINTTWLREGLLPFLRRSNSTPETLGLDMRYDTRDLEALLGAVPTLKRLDINIHNLTNHFFEYMTASYSNIDPVLPALEYFRIQINSFDLSDPFASMVESRWWTDSAVVKRNGVSRLTLVTLLLSPSDSVSPSDLDRLKKCAAQGMRFYERERDDRVCTPW